MLLVFRNRQVEDVRCFTNLPGGIATTSSNAYNKDKPFNQFIIEQIAGDLIPDKRPHKRRENLVATAFPGIGSYELRESGQKTACHGCD